MVNKDKQDRLDRFFQSSIASKHTKLERITQDVNFYEIWDWMVKNKCGTIKASKHFKVNKTSIDRWIEKTEHDIQETKRDSIINGVPHYQCSICDEVKEVNSDNFSVTTKNSRGYRAQCKECVKQKYKRTK